MRSILLCAAILAAALIPSASASTGDAGTDRDAGISMDEAIPVALGTFEGTMPQLDYGDAFRFDLPEGTGVRFIVTPLEGRVGVQTLRADGSGGLAWAGPSEGPMEVRGVAYDGVVGLGVYLSSSTWPVSYRVEASVMPRDDIAIIHLEATPRDPLGLQRDVRVVMENQGAGHNGWTDEWLYVHAIHADGAVRYVGSVGSWGGEWQIAPGSTREFVIPWDTFGEIGDVQLVATLRHSRDEDQSDNVRAIGQTVLREGEGMDLFNQRREVGSGEAQALVEWRSSPRLAPGVPFLWGHASVGSGFAYCRTERSIGFVCGFPGLEPAYETVVDALP